MGKILLPPLSHVCFAPRNDTFLGSRFLIFDAASARDPPRTLMCVWSSRRTVLNHLKNEEIETSIVKPFLMSRQRLSLTRSLIIS